jgi:hypothetical protein
VGVADLDALRDHVWCADHPRDTAEQRMYGAAIWRTRTNVPKDLR